MGDSDLLEAGAGTEEPARDGLDSGSLALRWEDIRGVADEGQQGRTELGIAAQMAGAAAVATALALGAQEVD